jgi:hypothetical protein
MGQIGLRAEYSWELARGSMVLDGWDAGAMRMAGAAVRGMGIRDGAGHTLDAATLDMVTLDMAMLDMDRCVTFTRHAVFMGRPRLMAADSMADAGERRSPND